MVSNLRSEIRSGHHIVEEGQSTVLPAPYLGLFQGFSRGRQGRNMALWRRFGSGFESLIHCRMERYFSAGAVTGLRGFRALEEPFSQSNPIYCYTHFRSFMDSGQIKPKSKVDVKGADLQKPKVEEANRIRLNEEIRDPEVRLVTDQGHRVVTLKEALFLARKHGLDLVEVQRKVQIEGGSGLPVFRPAVCKLMDYYKEKYKQDTKGKERAKSHATIALRNGENKEVRFKAKTELKDLKIKAEAVKRLMERGYRVKCTAMHAGKDDEDLGSLLLNLLQLIEDISIVESGPHLDTKNPYIIVKHIKFTSKKGIKVSNAMEIVRNVLSARPVAASETSSTDKGEDSLPTKELTTVESGSEAQTEVPPKQSNTNTPNHVGKAETIFVTKNERPNLGGAIPYPAPQAPAQPEQSNRYRSGSNAPPSANRAGGAFPGRFAAGNQNQGRMRERSGSNEGQDRGQFNPRDRPARTFNPGSPSTPRNGVFRASEGSDSIPPAVTFTQQQQQQQRYGVFSPVKSPPPVNDPGNNSSSPTPRYGIFSTPRTISSDEQMKRRDVPGNVSPPSPRFGNFTSSKRV